VGEVTSICGEACSGSSSSSSSSSSSASSASSSSGSVGPGGGTIASLSFAIVGDTRPPTDDDTAGYPTAVITQIWQDIQNASPRPLFAVTTGDYMFASPSSNPSQVGPQLDLYLGARNVFSNIVFPVMGNHECTGQVTSNCGAGNPDGITTNYTQFIARMLQPIGQSQPYYTINFNGPGNAWTAKFVMLACSAWTSAQGTWMDAQLSKPTTYTFVVRHAGTIANTVPCVTPSDQILANHPYTLLIVGHTHEYAYYANEKQIVVGNGGAPLTGSSNYGYVIARQQPGGTIQFTEYDYATNAVNQQFSVQ
jgi:hypothetical protein